MIEEIIADLERLSDAEKAIGSARFFKTGKGEYGEGDVFIGVNVPDQRKVARKYWKEVSLKEVEKLLRGDVHEHRLTALFLLVLKFQRGDDSLRAEIFDLYLRNMKYVNNWDLVDSSAPYIVGAYLIGAETGMDSARKVLYKLAGSKDLWERRIAILSTFAFIKEKDFDDALNLAEILVNDSHDLMHKAVGWMLREIGNRNMASEEGFLKRHYKTMPRTMLRYAIEKFPEEKRRFYMGK